MEHQQRGPAVSPSVGSGRCQRRRRRLPCVDAGEHGTLTSEHDPRPVAPVPPEPGHTKAVPTRVAPTKAVSPKAVSPKDPIVDMSSRRALRQTGDGDVPVDDELDDTVVDLRPPGTPSIERRSPEVVAAAPPPAPDPSWSPPGGSAVPRAPLSRRVLRVVGPSLAVLVVTLVLAGAAVARSNALEARADDWQDTAGVEAERTDAIDDVWAAVLGAVAAGVGQRVEAADALPALVGDAMGERSAPAPTDEAARELESAASARLTFLDQVDSALDRSGDAPIELGNELTALERSRIAAVEASGAASERAAALRSQSSESAAAVRSLALVVLLLGLLGAVVAVELARRRLRWGLDHPVADLQVMLDRLGGASPVQQVVPRGYPELTWLAVELQRRSMIVDAEQVELRRRADRGEQSRRILEALELAEDEPSSHVVLERALAEVGGDRRVELLLAERGSTVLQEVAANPNAASPGCPVDTTVACVALRRGQVSVFDSSESINACPKLRGRSDGPCSAACVPVTVAGRPVGVVHMIGRDGSPPAAPVVEELVGLATQIGTRFGALRTLESSRHEASTDGLTGLPNRRTLEAQVAELFERDTPFVMVLADLDRFKRLNDNFGHETGDRALQLFAGVLRDNVRGNDVVARLGGEEFVLVYPNMSVEISLEAIDRVRAALARTLDTTTLPPFTCSFGIAHSSVGNDGDAVLRVADAGLLQAKDLGGDSAVAADESLAATIFAEDSPDRIGHDDGR